MFSLSIKTKDLKSMISDVIPFARGSHGTNTNYILFSNDNKNLIVSADNNLAFCAVKAQETENFTPFCISGSTLKSILNTLPQENDILIYHDEAERKLFLSCNNKIAFTLQTLAADKEASFSVKKRLHSIAQANTLKVSAKSLADGIKRLLVSLNLSQAHRNYTDNVLLYSKDNKYFLVGTNGFILCHFMLETTGSINIDKKGILIPSYVLRDVLKVIADTENVEIFTANNTLYILANNTIMGTSLGGGDYPDFDRVISEFNENLIGGFTIDKDTFVSVLKRALATYAGENLSSHTFNQIPKGSFSVKDDCLHVSCGDDESNSGYEDTAKLIENKLNGTFNPSYNMKYMYDIISSIDDDTIHLLFPGLQGPTKIMGAKDPEETFFFIMPLRS